MSGPKIPDWPGFDETPAAESCVEIYFSPTWESRDHLFTDDNDRRARELFGGSDAEWFALGWEARMTWREKAYAEAKP